MKHIIFHTKNLPLDFIYTCEMIQLIENISIMNGLGPTAATGVFH